LLAISRCLFRSIEANPRSSFATVPSSRSAPASGRLLRFARPRKHTGCNAGAMHGR
jgi:hypothetical protein